MAAVYRPHLTSTFALSLHPCLFSIIYIFFYRNVCYSFPNLFFLSLLRHLWHACVGLCLCIQHVYVCTLLINVRACVCVYVCVCVFSPQLVLVASWALLQSLSQPGNVQPYVAASSAVLRPHLCQYLRVCACECMPACVSVCACMYVCM